MTVWWAEAILGAFVSLLFFLLRRTESRMTHFERDIRTIEMENVQLRAQVWKEEKITRTINKAVRAAFNEFRIEWLTEEKRKLEHEPIGKE
jgi:hypothetical protein